jgi:glycerol-3-phosphate cytidylyltransferase/D-beta-D-heptose 7-phosphate kinase/D-beta-D-heptose 1-phosphate adenosyltransferase
MIEAAAELGDKLVVIVNNDYQQQFKKGKIILDETNRVRLMRALCDIDEVVLAVDRENQSPTSQPVSATLERLARRYADDQLVFANGGDRDSAKAIPEAETCQKYNIEMVFGVGGTDKFDSSTRINRATGAEQ